MRTATIPFDPYEEDTSGFFGSIAKGLAKVAKVAATPITAPAKLVGKTLGKVPVLGGVVNAVNSLALAPINVTQQLLEGGRIDKVMLNNFKQTLANIKTIGPYAQTIISFVPGIGTGVSAAIGAGLALAEGKRIDQALIAGVKGSLPGGPAAQMAFSAAESAIQGKPIDQIAISALPLSDQQKKLLAQGLNAAKDIAKGKNVAKSLVDNAVKTLPADYAKAVQIGMAMGHAKSLQGALKTGAAGAASLGASTLSKNLTSGAKNMNFGKPFIQAARSLGTSQGGIQKALGAAQAIKNGSPVLKKALNSAVGNFAKNSAEHVGFNTAVKVLKETSGNKNAMAFARRNLPSQAAQHAFDTAVGVVSHTVSKNPGALAKRANSIFVPQLAKAKGVISPYQPNLKAAIDTIKRNPTLAAQHPLVLANMLKTSQQTVLEALKKTSGQRLLPWRSLTPRAASFIQKYSRFANTGYLGHGTYDTAGLDETGTKYIVEKGDSPFKIALKLTGNGGRWTELKALNADKKPPITQNIWTGEVLNIPPSWQKPVAAVVPSPGPALTSQPAPVRVSAPTGPGTTKEFSTAPAILQAKAILVTWSKTDGANQAGLTDYGSTAADMSTDFGARDKLVLQSFQNWSNKTGHAPLVVDGILGPKSMAALQSWVEKRAAAAVPAAVASVPSVITPTVLPEIVVQASAPVPVASAPVTIPTPAGPVTVSAPAAIPVAIPAVVASIPAPATPSVATPSQPATPASVAATTPAQSGSKMGPALAGAALGGTLFGLPGAIIGGIAGAAIA